jgi:hypothetical protein
LALDGNCQVLENLGGFEETISIKLNIPDVPSKLKVVPHGCFLCQTLVNLMTKNKITEGTSASSEPIYIPPN